jgi:signal peptidase I
MYDLYTKRVEVNPGDTIVRANGERWEVPSNLRYIFVEEDTYIERTGPVVVRADPKKIRILATRAKKAREYPR